MSERRLNLPLKIGLILALCGILVAAFALLGWMYQEKSLVSMGESEAALNPMTAICSILIGFSYVIIGWGRKISSQPRQLQFSRVLAVIVLLISILKACSFLGWEFRIDQVFKTESMSSEMSLGTTFGLFCLSLSVLFIKPHWKIHSWVSQAFALLTFLTSCFALIGYSYGSSTLLRSDLYEGMSLNTAVTFSLLALSFFCLFYDEGWVRTVSSKNLGGVVARRLLPVSFFLPLLIGIGWMLGVQYRLYDESYAISASTLMTVIALMSIVWWMSMHLNSVDEARTESEIEQIKLNRELEKAVEELQELNQELKAFSYSVAHDLRNPLRSMSFFSWSVLKDSSEKLSERARQDISQVYESSQKMSELINGLMSLYQVNRAEIKKNNVNLGKAAREYLERKKEEDKSREVEVRIAENLLVQGDGVLLENLLFNLLDNAWKFSSKKDLALIEFGCEEKSGKKVFYIKDNGVGFKMDFSNQLFRTFKRLHKAEEFPGTGIGLVTAKRIVQRHGGDISVFSQPGEGTCFYFTLGN